MFQEVETPTTGSGHEARHSDGTLDSLLYEQVAERLRRLIGSGTLPDGERVPSVRRLAAQQSISVSTVLQAYRVLESEGWIEARPQSGYYVRPARRRRLPQSSATPSSQGRDNGHLPPEPEVSQPSSRTTEVRMGDLVMRVLQASNRPGLMQLGAAICAPSTFPTRQLNRTLAAVARRDGDLANSYDFPPGHESLRAQIAHRAMEAGCSLAPDDIVLTLGCTEALNLCLRALASPGDTILLESPTYYNVLQIIESLGLRALEIPTHPRDGIVLEALEDALEREDGRVKACVFMPSWNNPLGSCMAETNKQRLVRLLAEREVPLVEDDVWGDTAWSERRPRAAKSYDTSGNVLLCSSFSKTLCPGYRVGWVAPGRWKKQIQYLKMVSSNANPTLPTLAVAEFLHRGGYEHHLRRLRRLYAEGVEVALDAIGRFFPDGTRVTRPRGGAVLWVELPPAVDSIELFEAALGEGISIAPGPLFSARRKYLNFARLNCAYHPPDVLEDALHRLGRLVAARC